MRRHRIELDFDATREVERAVEYATCRRKRETPDVGPGASAAEREPQTVAERLGRLGDAHSRGLLDTEEFERRKDELMDG
ncbi:SHOCT domain-containing protein [Halorussus salilacus]|uniref:SHOCT domain-containing protein n=1 Tax=Halorussus salilacus TaxID=2953750 RepID=UPI00209CFFD8|nr:SHOCT domain-containing protein [Halorussus salilacus]USZ68740.1 SHOCT domain-containing protein [Halorussus salilacus]